MILEIGRAARRLDDWLQSRLGRPYNILLSIGLVAELVERVKQIPHALVSAPDGVRLAALLAMELALLLHQVSVLSHHIETRRRAPRPEGV